jgi:hypothetical protein
VCSLQRDVSGRVRDACGVRGVHQGAKVEGVSYETGRQSTTAWVGFRVRLRVAEAPHEAGALLDLGALRRHRKPSLRRNRPLRRADGSDRRIGPWHACQGPWKRGERCFRFSRLAGGGGRFSGRTTALWWTDPVSITAICRVSATRKGGETWITGQSASFWKIGAGPRPRPCTGPGGGGTRTISWRAGRRGAGECYRERR